MGFHQTKQMVIWVLNRTNGPKLVLARLNTRKYGYWPDPTIGIKQTKQTKTRVLPTPSGPKYGFFQDRTDRIMGINQTEQSEIWVLTRQNRPKQWYSADNRPRQGFCPEGTNRNKGFDQSKI